MVDSPLGSPIVPREIKPLSESHMSYSDLASAIAKAWENRADLTPSSTGEGVDAIKKTISLLDAGILRTANRSADGTWVADEWVKKAVLLGFRTQGLELQEGGPQFSHWYDKVDSKFKGWGEPEFKQAGFRAVPNCVVRRGAHIAKNAVLMPSFVNIGAYVDEGTMVDTWVTVGSCAQIGKNVHLSGGVGIGGVLEPLQASPTIIEDNCFIGARSEVVEGVIVREGSVLSMGVFIGQSTKIYNRATGEVTYGEVPPYSVIVPGSLPAKDGSHSLNCAVIVKTVDAKTRSKTGINELLRD